MVVPNQIVFTKENYGNSKRKMMLAVAKQIDTLFQNRYVCVVREDEDGIVVIEFEHDNKFVDYGTRNPYWLTSEELWELEAMREEEDDVEQ